MDGHPTSNTIDFDPTTSRDVATDEDTKFPRKKNRVSKAERLAAEHAVWVRQKFDLPPDELLIASFSAALVRHILLQGRIHITTSCICFYAKIFGRITKESFPFTSISRVKKRKGGFVANAIKIYFSDPGATSIVIGSLNQRERAFSIIQARLRELNPAAAQPRDADDIGSAASAQGDSEDRSFDDDDYQTEPTSKTNVRGSDESLRARPPLSAGSSPSMGRRSSNVRRMESDTASDQSSRKSSDVDNISKLDNVSVSSVPAPKLVWRTCDDVCDLLSANAAEKKTERARTILNSSVVDAFNVLFVSDWLKHYHAVSNNKDLTISEWTRGEDGYMTRELTFRRPLGYKIGPKETRVKERQKYSFTSDGAVIVELQGQNLDAPYAEYFVVETFFELRPYRDGSLTLFIASVAVHFFKSTILRGKIESGAMSETKNAYQRLMNLAGKRIDEYNASRRSLNCGNRQANDFTVPDTNMTGTPTNMLCGTEEDAMPAMNIGESRAADCAQAEPLSTQQVAWNKDECAASEGTARSPWSGAAINDKVLNGSIEVRDSTWTKWLRMVEIGALVVVCVLLIAVLILLSKMHNNVIALEKLVLESRLSDAKQYVNGVSCGAEGSVVGGA